MRHNNPNTRSHTVRLPLPVVSLVQLDQFLPRYRIFNITVATQGETSIPGRTDNTLLIWKKIKTGCFVIRTVGGAVIVQTALTTSAPM